MKGFSQLEIGNAGDNLYFCFQWQLMPLYIVNKSFPMISGSNQRLPNIFGTGFFRIPGYQRGYAWKEKQLVELWDDLEDIQKKPNSNDYRPHYTGMLSLKAIPNGMLSPEELTLVQKGQAEFFDVVDGQQRLTTILILLYVLSKKPGNKYLQDQYIRTKGKNLVYKFCYGSSNSQNNNNCIKGEIFDDPHTLPSHPNVYTNNLKFAKDFFEKKVGGLSGSKQKELVSKIVNALQFDVKVIDNDLDVQVVFETMNNRGKQLTILEKLKNRLMYLASKQTSSSTLSSFINQSWGTIYENLGKNKEMLDEDEYLSSHLTLLREPADYSFSVKDAERKVFEMFCSRANKFLLSDRRDQGANPQFEPKVDALKIQNYATDIAKFVPSWYKIHNLDLQQDYEKRMYTVLCLNRSKEMRIFLAQLASMTQFEEQAVIECLDLVENILFINRLPLKDKVIDERRFANFARELHAQSKTLTQLIVDLKQDRSSLPISVNSIIDGFKGLFTYVYREKGYHRWAGLKYFLFKYEEEIRLDKYPKDFPIMEWTRFDETSIEHILPQDPAAHWQQEMGAYFNGKNYTGDEKKEAEKILINSLGNLTILRDVKNPSLGNKPWSTKQPAYSSGCFLEKEISKMGPWGAPKIYERGKKMIDYMKKLIPVLNNMTDPGDYETLLFCDKKYLP